MKHSLPECYSHESQMTKSYAYLLQQMEEVSDLAKHTWTRFANDDQDEWNRSRDINRVTQSDEKAKLYFRSSVETRTRKQTFSYLIFCQAYNGLDAYLDRILIYAPQHYRLPNKGVSKLEMRRYDLHQNGVDFLVNELDYQRINTIRDCRSIITHNQGVITPAFNRLHPAIPPGVGQRLILYPVDIAEDTGFLIGECFRLDQSAARCFGIEQRTFEQWQDEYGVVEGYGPSVGIDPQSAIQT